MRDIPSELRTALGERFASRWHLHEDSVAVRYGAAKAHRGERSPILPVPVRPARPAQRGAERRRDYMSGMRSYLSAGTATRT